MRKGVLAFLAVPVMQLTSGSLNVTKRCDRTTVFREGRRVRAFDLMFRSGRNRWGKLPSAEGVIGVNEHRRRYSLISDPRVARKSQRIRSTVRFER
jgi:hypothetical protein